MRKNILLTTLVCFTMVACLSDPRPAFTGTQGTNGNEEFLIGKEALTAVELAREYRRAGVGEQQAILKQIAEHLRERGLLLAKVAEKEPGAVHRLMLPKRLLDVFPDACRSGIEQHADLEGTLQVVFEEYGDRHLLRHYLVSNGRRLELRFITSPPSLMNGTRVRAHGIVLGAASDSSTETAMVVDSGSAGIEVLADGGITTTTTSTSVAAVIPPNTFGEQKTAVLLINFPAKTTQPWTVEQARTLVFGTPNDFIRENSSGQTWMTGDVFGWLTIPVDISTCDAPTIAWQAQQTAKNAGIDLSSYGRFIYAFPDIGCAWSGLATVGGTPSEAWFDGTLGLSGVVSHEIGHTFGLAHSHAMECGSQVLSSDGTSIDYGDVLDVMGNNSGGHFNAFQKKRLGWLDYGSSPLMSHVVTSGAFDITPYAAPGSTPKALQIPQGTDASGRPVSLFVEYRQPVGFDSFLTGSPYATNVGNGVVVHLGTDGDFQSSYLLDMTPQSQSSDWNDPALTVGKSYYDPASGVTITTQSVGSSGATVNVSYATPQCVPATPTVAVTPAQGAWVAAGSTVQFSITIGNTDSSACSSTTYSLSSLLPAGWLGSYSQQSLNLAPGASGTATLSVTSAADAADGYYNFTVSAVDSANASHKASAIATYVISGTVANQPPVAGADSASTAVNVAVNIPVLANDSDPDGDPLKVSSVTQGMSGTVTANSNGTVTYTPRRRFTGTDQFNYTLNDGKASATAVVTVTVTASSKKGK